MKFQEQESGQIVLRMFKTVLFIQVDHVIVICNPVRKSRTVFDSHSSVINWRNPLFPMSWLKRKNFKYYNNEYNIIYGYW